MNSRTWQLLHLLADGEFHSGEELGRQLGVSRATVFAALADVGEQGVVLQRIRGRGYRLAQPWHCLEVSEISCWLGDAVERFRIEVLQQAASSNTELLHRTTQGALGGSVVALELQTAGRGRIGRVWHSGLGNALTFSLLWRFDCGLNGLSGLSLVAGVAILRALRRFDATQVRLKWPNDIVCAQGKLGGVLIEAQGDMYGPSAVVIGIGINCSLPFNIEQAITQPAAALNQVCAEPPERNHLMAAMLQELAGVLDEFSRTGFATMRTEWQLHHAYQDMPVQMRMPDGSTASGVARGVSDLGELCLETVQGLQRFNSGEVGAGL